MLFGNPGGIQILEFLRGLNSSLILNSARRKSYKIGESELSLDYYQPQQKTSKDDIRTSMPLGDRIRST